MRAFAYPSRQQAHKGAPPSSGTPAWLAGVAVNAFVQIPGTSGAGGSSMDAWGSMVPIDGTSKIVMAANGGHTDSADNSVTGIDLSQDSPAWIQLVAPTSVGNLTANASYNADGKPGSRHNYHHAHYIAQRNRVMLFGQRGRYVDGGDNYTVDGVDVSNWTSGGGVWDAAGTWASTAGSQGFGVSRDPATGNVWTTVGYRWNQASNTWTRPVTFPTGFRWPSCYDSARQKVFTLQWQDGQGFAPYGVVIATQFDASTGSQATISFNASSAYTQFQSDQPTYSGMDYDPVNDRFLFYCGMTTSSGTLSTYVPTRVYVITPNAGTTWDMSILTLDASSATPANVPSSSSGINGRWKYIPTLKGFALFPRSAANMYFLRTS